MAARKYKKCIIQLFAHCIATLCALSQSLVKLTDIGTSKERDYNPFLVYCRELAPSTVSLTGDRAQGDDCEQDSHFRQR